MSGRNTLQSKTPYTDDDWLQVLEACDVQFAVLTQRQDGELIEALRRQPGWSVDFEGDGMVILARCLQGITCVQELIEANRSQQSPISRETKTKEVV